MKGGPACSINMRDPTNPVNPIIPTNPVSPINPTNPINPISPINPINERYRPFMFQPRLTHAKPRSPLDWVAVKVRLPFSGDAA